MRIKIFILFIFISFGALSQNSIFWLNKPNKNKIQWVGTSTNGHLSYSFDERTFTDNYNGSYSYGNVDWSGERWIAIRSGDLIYSFDGITWISYGFSGVSYIFWDVYNRTWVGQKNDGGIYYTIKSPDGITWSNHQTNYSFGKIISTGIRYVGVNYNSNYIGYSSDGINWQTRDISSTFPSAQVYDIVWNGSVVLASGTYYHDELTKSTVWQSTDGAYYSLYFRDDYQINLPFVRIIWFKNKVLVYNSTGSLFNLTNGTYMYQFNDATTYYGINNSKDRLLFSTRYYNNTLMQMRSSLDGINLNYWDDISYILDNLKHRSIIKYNIMMSTCPQSTLSVSAFSVNYMDMINTIDSDGGLNVESRGICWSTTSSPTISDNVAYGITNNTSEIIRAQPLSGGTQYYMRAFVRNSQCITYSNQILIQTYDALPATVVTTEPTNIGSISAVSGGNVTQDGGGFIEQRGVCWSTSSNPVYTGNHTEDGTGTGVFISNISGLSPNTLYYVRAYAINSAGVVYGDQYSFTTTSAPTAPLVTTLDPLEITNQSAHLYGRIDSDGGASVSEYGFTYGTSPNPDLSGGSVAIGSGVGAFDIILSGIPSATTFHYRAYAINSVETSYGVDKSFTTLTGGLPIVETYGAYNIDETSAYISGTIVDTGSATITTTGFIIGLATNPDPTLSSNLFFTQHDGVVAYDQFTGLTSGTTYKARMYAINEAGTAYGNVISFQTTSTGVVPSVSTTAISDITINSAASGGTVTFDGGSTITARGVCWNTTGNPTIADNKTSDGGGTGSFTSSLTGLVGGTTYYVRAYATNSSGTAYGNQYSFTTNCELPSFISASCGNTTVTESSLDVTATILSDGGCQVTSRGFQYSTDASFNTVLGSVTASGTGIGQYSAIITGLSCGTHYYFRPWATNSVGTYYATSIVGTGCSTMSCTPSTLPIITASSAYGTIPSQATISINATSDGGSSITAKGVQWSVSSSFLSILGSTNEGGGIGSVQSTITNLQCNRKYYIRAYATNGVGTSYSPTVQLESFPVCGFFTSVLNTSCGSFNITDQASLDQACSCTGGTQSTSPNGGYFIAANFEVGEQLYSDSSFASNYFSSFSCVGASYTPISTSFYAIATNFINLQDYKVHVVNGVIQSITSCP